jgi:hypothetical protein
VHPLRKNIARHCHPEDGFFDGALGVIFSATGISWHCDERCGKHRWYAIFGSASTGHNK